MSQKPCPRVAQLSQHRGNGCDALSRNADFLQEMDEAEERERSREISDDSTSMKVTRFFSAKIACTKNTWLNSGGKPNKGSEL